MSYIEKSVKIFDKFTCSLHTPIEAYFFVTLFSNDLPSVDALEHASQVGKITEQSQRKRLTL